MFPVENCTPAWKKYASAAGGAGDKYRLWDDPLHYAKVVKTRFEVVNFDKLILHQFSTKMSQIFNDGVKTSKFLKK